MKIGLSALFILLAITACGESEQVLVYNENNTSVVNGVVYDMHEKPINGLYKIYYPNGAVRMEIESKNGLPNGVGKFYGEDGVLVNQTTFKDGITDGILYNYYPDGQVHNELVYVNGVLHGAQKTYDENGELIVEITYENGKAVKGFTVVDDNQIALTEDELKQLEN
ncbi:MAG: hypothetical protein VZR95_02600 [Alphaproteobacteria bacterium]